MKQNEKLEFHADGSMCWDWLCKCKKIPVTAEALEKDKQSFIDLAEKIYVDKSFVVAECAEAIKDCQNGTFEQRSVAHSLLLKLHIKLREVLERERNLSNKWWIWHIQMFEFLEDKKDTIEKS